MAFEMTEVKKPLFRKLLQRLQASQGSTSNKVVLNNSIQPTIDIDKLTLKTDVLIYSTTNTAGSSTLTCPVGKMYYPLAVWYNAAQSGDFSVQSLLTAGAGTAQTLTTSFAQTLTMYQFPYGFVLNAGETVQVLRGAGTSGSISINIFYLEIDA